MKKADEFGAELEMFGMGRSNVKTRTLQSQHHTIYLDDVIGAPAEYRDAMQVLETAGPNDVVFISINSPGGRLDSGLMLINGIRACEAQVVGQIHADCGSMATGIALACSSWQLSEFSYFFIHTASHGMVGKAQEVQSQADFMNKYIDHFLKSMYTGFLSPKELEKVSKGEDMWIGSEELSERLTKYAEYRNRQEEKQLREQERQFKAMIKELKNATPKGSA